VGLDIIVLKDKMMTHLFHIYVNLVTTVLVDLKFSTLVILDIINLLAGKLAVFNVIQANTVIRATHQHTKTALLDPTVLLELDLEQNSSVLKALILTALVMILLLTVSLVL